ncbi:MAG TPA: DsbA family protein [Hyphomicrobiales bacterium]|nr:DsbA family protein [Hyphomicrobiales bacterium]
MTVTATLFRSLFAAALLAAAGLGAARPAAAAGDPDQAALMQPGPLPEETLGNPKAPVTIVEYASMTCPHCAAFDEETFPTLKKDYIDTGKVYYIFREFPLDNFATAGFVIARCVPKDQYFAVVHAFFKEQPELAAAPDALKWIEDFAKQVGLTPEQTQACLTNQKLLDDVMAVRQNAAEKLGVDSTPTFFINGKVHRGEMSVDELKATLDPLLKS